MKAPFRVPQILAISGRKGSGKSTVVEMLQGLLPMPYQHKLFAGPLKQMVGVMVGVDPIRFEDQAFKLQPSPIANPDGGFYTYRHLLQVTGTDFGRDILGENVWVDSLFAPYRPDDCWLISDCRFPNEVKAVENRSGMVIRVERPGLAYDPHPSETALDDYPFAHVVINDGSIAELHDKIKAIVCPHP